MISTIAMIRCGRTYGNYMVGMSASNAKLADRAARIVSDVTGTPVLTARTALEAAGHEVKTAIVMIERGLPAEAARSLLADHADRLDEALSTGDG
jgi:N-acetylmuramic acid 6-phosphate etherase